MHTKTQVEVQVNGKLRTRVRIACEVTGTSFVIHRDGEVCDCGQMFNLVGQKITHRGY